MTKIENCFETISRVVGKNKELCFFIALSVDGKIDSQNTEQGMKRFFIVVIYIIYNSVLTIEARPFFRRLIIPCATITAE